MCDALTGFLVPAGGDQNASTVSVPATAPVLVTVTRNDTVAEVFPLPSTAAGGEGEGEGLLAHHRNTRITNRVLIRIIVVSAPARTAVSYYLYPPSLRIPPIIAYTPHHCVYNAHWCRGSRVLTSAMQT